MDTLRQTRRRRRSIHQDEIKAPAIESDWRAKREGEEVWLPLPIASVCWLQLEGWRGHGTLVIGQVEAGAGRAPEAEVHTPLLPLILALMALTWRRHCLRHALEELTGLG